MDSKQDLVKFVNGKLQEASVRLSQNPHEEAKMTILAAIAAVAGFAHMLFSKDKKWDKKRQPDSDELLNSRMESITIVLVRHGESEWNDVFNRGFGPGFILRLAAASIREVLKYLSPDSVYFDSPLSAEGVAQSRALALFLAADTGASQAEAFTKALVNGTAATPKSVIAASNLRRALATAAIAMQVRIQRTGEKVHVLSSLQEITCNVDGLTVTPPRTQPVLNEAELACDASGHLGNKPIRRSGLPRLREFADWAFARPGREAVIAVGHSGWFRAFFDLYLPKALKDHPARLKKIVNCGVVAFTLQRGTGEGGRVGYRIEPESICVLYGGFGK